MAYLATSWYGGFGTELYSKERQAENIALALVEAGVGTRQVLSFLDAFYFRKDAVADILATTIDNNAAQVILILAQAQAGHEHLALVADKFLKKKVGASELRKAIRMYLDAGHRRGK